MANHKSAEKRARQAARRTVYKNDTRKSVRSCEKRLRTAIEEKNKKLAEELFREFSSNIDKAALKKAVHRRNASRKIGRLAHEISGLSA